MHIYNKITKSASILVYQIILRNTFNKEINSNNVSSQSNKKSLYMDDNHILNLNNLKNTE